MTRLRRRMSEDMQVRGLSPSTQRVYLERVTQFADYFVRSPETLGDRAKVGARRPIARRHHWLQGRDTSAGSFAVTRC